jgi:tetratricopeptide (TPR) repeat protein
MSSISVIRHGSNLIRNVVIRLQQERNFSFSGSVFTRHGGCEMAEPIVSELLQIAGAYGRMGRVDQAEHIYKKVLQIQTRNHLFETADTALAMYELGVLYSNEENAGKAIEYFKMALRIWDQIAHFEPVPFKLRLHVKQYLKEQAHEIVAQTIARLPSNDPGLPSSSR